MDHGAGLIGFQAGRGENSFGTYEEKSLGISGRAHRGKGKMGVGETNFLWYTADR